LHWISAKATAKRSQYLLFQS